MEGWNPYKTRKGIAGGVMCRYPSPDKTFHTIAIAGFFVAEADFRQSLGWGMQAPEIWQNNRSIEGCVIHSSIGN